ncbi:Aste57867_11184 [Aphanomyces stellatus]|uniref:Aste57867_11184 protein n=1 Tax=Aphanomyces stellatus TaxID=120398 RepID=A0A485KSU4_9STRA|nr:hypothetical protein As57867_011142 [Aphanomyces stellatus]VFT88051.1 Aste57867_11184 [Aphanomyces stellatus]
MKVRGSTPGKWSKLNTLSGKQNSKSRWLSDQVPELTRRGLWVGDATHIPSLASLVWRVAHFRICIPCVMAFDSFGQPNAFESTLRDGDLMDYMDVISAELDDANLEDGSLTSLDPFMSFDPDLAMPDVVRSFDSTTPVATETYWFPLEAFCAPSRPSTPLPLKAEPDVPLLTPPPSTRKRKALVSPPSLSPKSKASKQQTQSRPNTPLRPQTQVDLPPMRPEPPSRRSRGKKPSGECTIPGCTSHIRTHGLCKRHGGGKRCQVEGCNTCCVGGLFCIAHGGGKLCTMPGCAKAIQSRGLCKAHGGGARCEVEGCKKSSQGGGRCTAHGGGKRCRATKCKKAAQRGGYCGPHKKFYVEV